MDSLDNLLAKTGQESAEIMRQDRSQRLIDEANKWKSAIGGLRPAVNLNKIYQIVDDVYKYYAIASSSPSWDIKEKAWDALVATYPDTKEVKKHNVGAIFRVFGIELVYTESWSGLMWTRDGNIFGKDDLDEQLFWKDAKAWVKRLTYGGYNDWRLPTKEEFLLFTKQTRLCDAWWLNSNGFYNVKSDGYWSSTLRFPFSSDVWYHNMSHFEGHYDNEFRYCYIWPVRGGR